uniref:Crinkler effector protein N-terminal domain-containing protein n=1 Tax=Globisporangium ultimum (strain ATCC 200006 / CBS 805.95 / DAOM BR144) TaxID=431595 RepID=K3XBL9_GLOUD
MAALVGVKCGAFRIDMEASMTVCDLRKAVKERENGRISDTDELDLYLTKRTEGDENNAWLRDDDDATVQLENRAVPSHIKAIVEDEKGRMKAMWTLQKWMDENKMSLPPASRHIHVLVVVR